MLKSNFYNREILISTRILIQHPIMITECRALLSHTKNERRKGKKHQKLSVLFTRTRKKGDIVEILSRIRIKGLTNLV